MSTLESEGASAAVSQARRNLTAIGLIVAMTVSFALLDATAKYATQFFDPFQIVWGRYLFHFLLLMPILLRKGPVQAFASARPGLNIARGLMLCVITLLFFSSIKYLPLVDAQAISFITPLTIVAIAHFVLGQRVGPRRWAAVAVGFVGVLIVIRPTGDMHWAALLCLGMALTNAVYHLATRSLARTESSRVQLLYAGLTGTLVFSLLVPFVWVTPDLEGWLMLMAMGAFGAAGHYLLGEAYARAQPAILAPFTYTQIIWAGGLGALFFGHVPDGWTLFGAAIVVGAGLYVFYRERAVARAGK